MDIPINYDHVSPNFWYDNSPIEAICLHATGDAAPGVMGSVNYLCSPGSGASVNYIISKKGEIFCIVNPYANKRAWGNGIYQSPDLSVFWLADLYHREINPNYRTISIEHEQLSKDMVAHNYEAFLQAQADSSAWLVNKLCHDFNVPIDDQHIIEHRQIQRYDRANCAGVIRMADQVRKVQLMSTTPTVSSSSHKFDETGFTISDLAPDGNYVGFYTYWKTKGLADLGLPIGEAYFDPSLPNSKGVLGLYVQYTERARIEHHPENTEVQYRVQEGLTGRESLTYKTIIENQASLIAALQQQLADALTKKN